MRDNGVCKILTILVAFVMVVSCAAMPSAGGVSESEVNVSNPDNTSSTELNKNPKLAFPYYQPINISVNISVPPYQLPLNLSIITNLENITGKIRLNDREKNLLKTNGFVILDYGYYSNDNIVAFYEHMKKKGIPIFGLFAISCG